MNKIGFVVMGLVFISACAMKTKFDVDPNNFSTLVNQRIENEVGFSLLFVALDGTKLESGEMTAPVKATYDIPAGKRNIVTRVIFDPNYNKLLGRGMFDAQFAFELNAKHGDAYMIKAEVIDGIVYSWVVNSEGQVVTNKMSERLKPMNTNATFVPIIISS